MGMAEDFRAFTESNRRGGGVKLNIETELAKLFNSPFDVPTGPTEQELSGIATLQSAADPTARLERGRERFESSAAPGIMSALTAAGFGRSGAVGESLANAFASQVSNPIEQQVAQALNILGQQQLSLGNRVAQRKTGKETSLVNRAIRILGQLQSLRTAQAGVNQRTSGGGGGGFRRGGGTSFSAFPRGQVVNKPNLFGSDPTGFAVGPRSSPAEFDAQTQNLISQSQLPPLGATIFGPSGNTFRPGDVLQGAGGRGKLSISSAPTTLRKTLFGS